MDREIITSEGSNQGKFRPDKSTPLQAYVNFLKSLIGIAIIALPYSTNSVGYIWGFIVFIPVALCSLKSNLFLNDVADNLQVDGLLYNDVVRVVLGGLSATIVEIFLILAQLSVCIAYLIFLTQSTTNSLLRVGLDVEKWVPFVISLIIIIPLSFVKKIHFFHKSSKIGMYICLFGLLIVFVDQVYVIIGGQYYLSNTIHIQNTFSYVGVVIFLCEGAPTLLPIRDSMQNKFEFRNVVISSIVTTFTLALVLAMGSVIAYGEDTQQIIIFSISNPYMQLAAIILYSINLILTYPLQLFPATQIIEEYFNSRSYARIGAEELNNSTEETGPFVTKGGSIVIRVALMVIIYFVAYWVPNFSHFINIAGSILANTLQFIFPTLLHLVHFRKTNQKYSVTFYVIILSIAAMTMVLGTFHSVKAFIVNE